MELHRLSGEQLALIPRVRAEWLKIGLDTAPVDRAKVREILGRMYALGRKPIPKHIVHLESPLQIHIALARLRAESEQLSLQVADPVSQQVRAQLRLQFANQANKQARDLISSQDRFEFTVAALAPDLQISEHIRAQIREEMQSQFGGPMGWPFTDDFGSLDVSLAWFDFVGRLGIDVSKLAPTLELAKSCGWIVLFWEWAFISAKPEHIHRDEKGRLHCETGAALRYPDGFSIFAIHGVRVPEKVVVSPKSTTVMEIECEENAEARRVMIDRYGPERYLMDSGAAEIHRDDYGILYRKENPGDEPLAMVKVVNATPEPDGRLKDYFLRVPPEMERARQAVAWTFDKEEDDYAPVFQT